VSQSILQQQMRCVKRCGLSDASRSVGFCTEHTVDNKSTIALIKNPVLHGQSKRIEVKYHLVRKSVENGRIKVEFIGSEE
jgi:hypothetical protein